MAGGMVDEKQVEYNYPHKICTLTYFILMKSASLHILCGYARMEIQYDIYEF